VKLALICVAAFIVVALMYATAMIFEDRDFTWASVDD
jgi:hypothetical protein